MIQASGRGADVHFDGQYVTINRTGGTFSGNMVGKGQKRVHISQVTAVHWTAATAWSGGFIRFVLPGAVEQRSLRGRQQKDAMYDENAVRFLRSTQPEFENLRAAVEQAIAAFHSGRTVQPVAPQPMPMPAHPTAPQSVPAQPVASPTEELYRLGQMAQQGLLSPAEFQAAKARLLGL